LLFFNFYIYEAFVSHSCVILSWGLTKEIKILLKIDLYNFTAIQYIRTCINLWIIETKQQFSVVLAHYIIHLKKCFRCFFQANFTLARHDVISGAKCWLTRMTREISFAHYQSKRVLVAAQIHSNQLNDPTTSTKSNKLSNLNKVDQIFICCLAMKKEKNFIDFKGV